MRSRPWAVWKIVLLVFVGGCVAGGVFSAFAFDDRQQSRQFGRAIGGALFFAAVAAGFLQAWRRRRWDEAVAKADVGEEIVATTTGQRVIDGRPHRGRLDLTASRIVFYRASRYDGWFGELVTLFAGVGRRYRAMDLPIADIASTARTVFRAVQNGLEITMTDGTVHRFTLDVYPTFDAALREARAVKAPAP